MTSWRQLTELQRLFLSAELTSAVLAKDLDQNQALLLLRVEGAEAQGTRSRGKAHSKLAWYAEIVTVKELSSEVHACKFFYLKICRGCKGKGTVNIPAKETISIPKGVDNGVNLRVAKKGHQA